MIPYYKIFLMASWLCSQGVRAESRELVKIPLPDLKSVSALPNQDKQIDAALKSDGEKKIADGSRYFLRQKGFSFIPPIGWERIQTQSGLLFQMPKEPNLDYQKTLQVLFFNGGVKWDNYSLESFGRLLLDRFSKRSNLVANYRLLNSASFPLTNTSPAQAYYTAFLYGSMPMMQLHILISNASRHALITFTDLASHFQADAIPMDHRAVYEALKSIELEGADGTSSYSELIYTVAFAVSAVVLFFLFRTISSWRRFRQLRKLAALPIEQHVKHVGNDPSVAWDDQDKDDHFVA